MTPRARLLVLSLIAGCGARAGEPHTAASDPTDFPVGLDTRLFDTTVDPCVDLYRYACGSFGKQYAIPPDQSRYSVGARMREVTERAMREILEAAARPRPDRNDNEQKIGDAYAACMDEAELERRGLAPLQPELARIAELTSRDALPALLAHDQAIGVDALFRLFDEQDPRDAREELPEIYPGGLGLPDRDYYLRAGADADRVRAAYLAHVARMLALLGDPDAGAEARAVVDFETALAKLTLDLTARRDPHNRYHTMSLAELQQLVPSFAWPAYFTATDAPAFTTLNVDQPALLRGTFELVAHTELATLQAYLRWSLIRAIPDTAVPRALAAEQFAFNDHVLSGVEVQPPRWQRCANAVETQLNEALSQVYLARRFSPATKAAAIRLTLDIEAAMAADIDARDWMSDATKQRAHAKLRAVTNNIAYPDRWHDYRPLVITRDDAFGNAMRATAYENHRLLGKIGQPPDRSDDVTPSTTVDAAYKWAANDINFPAGILQPPSFDPRATDADNYGRIGSTIGHELVHGFDDNGRQFDGAGNWVNWWTDDDARQFQARAACEVDEYSRFVVIDELKVNGQLTLGENIADNGGLQLAYAAFLAASRRNATDLDRKVDGFTPRQRFFVAYAQDFCGVQRPESLRLQVQTNEHAPRNFRVNGVVRNMPAFGEAFACQVGQPMRPPPDQVCRVW